MNERGEPDDSALSALEERLGHRFADRDLLRLALVHRSWRAENPASSGTNERLEFLGDAVLGFVVADLAYTLLDDVAEGLLSNVRQSVVNTAALAGVARSLGVGECLFLGRGENAEGGRDKDSILECAMEALIGAVHLDGGVAAAEGVVRRLFEPLVRDVGPRAAFVDAKTQLQELCARVGLGAPVYDTTGQGPDHSRTFTATVRIDGGVRATGTGRTKKAAEQVAASRAHDVIARDPGAE
ncbi:MAG: ribonuclease III [Actinobacteria bacterium]|nr:ribonuclease III [Actinomycetota bacterium]